MSALNTPLMIVNFKTYEQGTGQRALELAKILDSVSEEIRTNIAIAVQAVDIEKISGAVKIPVLAQHIDAEEYGAHTGAVLPEAVKAAGASGSLLSHSEKKLPAEILEKAIVRAKSVGLATIVCAATPDEAEKVAALKPDFIALEPPELIGGEISVSTAKPAMIKEFVEKVSAIDPEIKVLVGAGVHTAEDVKKSLELGAQGVLVASGIVKAENPEEVAKQLVGALKG